VYDPRPGCRLAGTHAHPRTVRFLGFYGDEARAHPGPAVTAVLSRFQQFQADDQRIRRLARAGDTRQATTLLTGRTPGSSGYDFDQYAKPPLSLITLHPRPFHHPLR